MAGSGKFRWRENYQEGDGLSAGMMSAFFRMMNRIRGVNGIRVYPRNGGLVIDGAGITGGSIAGISLPFDVTPGTTSTKHVTVAGGWIRHAGTWVEKTATELDCSAGDVTGASYVYYTIKRDDGTITGPAWAATWPTETDLTRIKDIATLTQAAGVVTAIHQTNHGQQDHEEDVETDGTRHSQIGATYPETDDGVNTSVLAAWSITAQPSGKRGVTKRELCNLEYNETSGKFWAYYQDSTYSRTGRLVGIAARGSFTVFTAVDC